MNVTTTADLFPIPTGERTAIEEAGLTAAVCDIWKFRQQWEEHTWHEVQAMRRTLMCFGDRYNAAVEELAWLQWFHTGEPLYRVEFGQ